MGAADFLEKTPFKSVQVIKEDFSKELSMEAVSFFNNNRIARYKGTLTPSSISENYEIHFLREGAEGRGAQAAVIFIDLKNLKDLNEIAILHVVLRKDYQESRLAEPVIRYITEYIIENYKKEGCKFIKISIIQSLSKKVKEGLAHILLRIGYKNENTAERWASLDELNWIFSYNID